jgi:SAM-dependent methyltransferase
VNGDSEKSGPMTARQRWDTALTPSLGGSTEVMWRAHADSVNASLLARWLPATPFLRLLKTDLFDEAMGDGLYPLMTNHARSVVAMDVASKVVASAVSRHPGLLAVSADVRRLPFANEAFEVVISNSTLDHFETRADIRIALRELHRVLCRGGRLLLTLDNLANPVVALRNALPFRLLHRLGIVPYPVGVTCRPAQLHRMLQQEGFEVMDTAALLHCPRVLAVPLARRQERSASPQSRQRFLRGLLRWERLANLPTRFLTGYFIGVSARKT